MSAELMTKIPDEIYLQFYKGNLYARKIKLIKKESVDWDTRRHYKDDVYYTRPRWISVKERLPVYDYFLPDVVFVLYKDKLNDKHLALFPSVGLYDPMKERWEVRVGEPYNKVSAEERYKEVLYWMPIPSYEDLINQEGL